MLNTKFASYAISASRIDRADERARVASRREGHKRPVNNSVRVNCGISLDGHFELCQNSECHKCEGTGITLERLAISLRSAAASRAVRCINPYENSYRVWRAQGMPPHPVYAPAWWRKYAYTVHGIRIAPAVLAFSPMPLGCKA